MSRSFSHRPLSRRRLADPVSPARETHGSHVDLFCDDSAGSPAATATALWSGTDKNRDVSTGPLARPFARPFARSLPTFTHSLAPNAHSFACSAFRALLVCSTALIHSFTRSLTPELLGK